MPKLYSDRHAKPLARYTYTVSEKARTRIAIFFEQLRARVYYFSLQMMLKDVGNLLLAKRGGLRIRSQNQSIDVSALEHFLSCTDEEALDFLEACFLTEALHATFPETRLAVAGINEILQEEGIGYELMEPLLADSDNGRRRYGPLQVIKKNEKTTHKVAVEPALQVLHDPRFAVASNELRGAFEKARRGDHAGAITLCGSGFESVMKTICDIKKWPHDANASCAELVDACLSNKLVLPFYADQLKGIGRIRNKLGDAHGKGPTHQVLASQEQAEHMIAVTCSHITFLIRQAKI